MLLKIMENIYSLIGLLFSIFVKKEENLWVFGARDGNAYCDNTRFFFEWLEHNKKNEIVAYWITKNSNIVDFNNKILLHNSIRGQWIIAKSSLVFVSHGAADVSRFIGYSKPYVYLWHGIPIKRMGRIERPSLLHWLKKIIFPKIHVVLFLVTSERDSKIFSEAYSISPSAFYIGQYPRNIKLTENAEQAVNVTDSSIHKYKILFAPTYRDNNDASYFDNVIMPSDITLGKLSSFLVDINAEFYFKLHPYTITAFCFDSLPSNIKLVDKNQDILDVLSTSDVLITDYSSVFFDFALLNRPIIHFLPDESWYLNDVNRGLYSDFLTSRAGECAFDWVGVLSLLRREIKNPTRTKHLRDRMISHFFSNVNGTNLQLFLECQLRQSCFYNEKKNE